MPYEVDTTALHPSAGKPTRATARRVQDVAADRAAQALHEAQCARIRAAVLDAGGAYAEGLAAWERAHDAAERANAWQQIHDHWCLVVQGRLLAPRRAPDDFPDPSFPQAMAS